jgi:hypothetical protein
MVERGRFELPIPVSRYDGFQDRCIQPLCHLSNKKTFFLFENINFFYHGGERGIRTLDPGLPRYSLSRGALSTTQPSLQQNHSHVRPRGIEPLTARFVVWYSIQLSYGRKTLMFKYVQEQNILYP